MIFTQPRWSFSQQASVSWSFVLGWNAQSHRDYLPVRYGLLQRCCVELTAQPVAGVSSLHDLMRHVENEILPCLPLVFLRELRFGGEWLLPFTTGLLRHSLVRQSLSVLTETFRGIDWLKGESGGESFPLGPFYVLIRRIGSRRFLSS